MRQQLQHRNGESISLADFKPDSNRIVMIGIPLKDKPKWSFYTDYPHARCRIGTCLPGDSQDGTAVVVRFSIGPTAHSALGTYLLVKQQGEWKVKWRHFSFFT